MSDDAVYDDSGDEVYAVWYEGGDGTTWTPTKDWFKNWRTYVTNVPECFRSDFEAPHGVYAVRSVAVLFVGCFLS